MDQVTLRAETGRELGSRPARRLRATGAVPGVVYGRGLEPIPVAVDGTELRAALSTEAGLNALINLDVGGTEHLTVPRELQRDAVRGTVLHLDFVKVSLTETIQADVAVLYQGEPIGVREDGGVGETVRTAVTVTALPTEIPQQIEIDVSDLRLGDSVKVSDLPPIEGVIYEDDSEATLYTIIVPRAIVEEVEEEELLEGEELEGEEIEGEEPETAEEASAEATAPEA